MASTGGVFKRGKHWWIRYSVGGRQFREATHTTQKELAVALLKKRETELFESRFFPEKRKGELSLLDLKDRWLKFIVTKGRKTDDTGRFAPIIEYFGQYKRIASITRGDVEDFIGHMRAKKTAEGTPLAPATINRHLALLRAAFNYAVQNNYLHTNPARGFPMLPEDNERDRVASREEYDRLITAANPQLRLAIIIAYYAGMRLGEIAKLTWEHIDLKQRVFKLKSSETKTRASRLVPIADPVLEELKVQPRQLDGRLFTATVATLSRWFAEACRELKIKGLKFHDLRHTAATNLRRAGVDIFTIKQVTGHKTLAMLERYNTIDVDDLPEAMNKVTQDKR